MWRTTGAATGAKINRVTRRRFLCRSAIVGLAGTCLGGFVSRTECFSSIRASVPAAGPITAMTASEHHLWVAQESTLWQLDLESLQPLRHWRLPFRKCQRLKLLSRDGASDEARPAELFAVGGDPGERGAAVVFSLPNAPDAEPREVNRWSDDGDVWNDLEVTPLGQVWFAGRDALVRAFDREANNENPLWRDRAHADGVTRLLALDSLMVSSSLDQSLRVREFESGEPVRELSQHVGGIIDLVALPPSGRLPQVASLGVDRTLRVWQPTIGRMVRFVRLDRTPIAMAADSTSMRVAIVTDQGDWLEIDALRAAVVRTARLIDEPWYCLDSTGRFAGAAAGYVTRLDEGRVVESVRLSSPERD